jgi:hypothetical protein
MYPHDFALRKFGSCGWIRGRHLRQIYTVSGAFSIEAIEALAIAVR